MPEGFSLVRYEDLDPFNAPGPDLILTLMSKCGEVLVVVEVTGTPEIRDIGCVTRGSRGRIVVGVVHHGGNVRGPVIKEAKRAGVLLVNCSSTNYLDLDEVFRGYLSELYEKCGGVARQG